MFQILFQPYPQKERTFKQHLLHSFAEGLFVYLFFIVLEPFGIAQWKDVNKNYYLLGYAAITMAATLFNRVTLVQLFPNYHKEENWTIGKEILSTIILLFIITCGVTIYSSIIFGWHVGLWGFLQMYLWVFIIGIFPTTFWVMYDYIHKLKKYSKPVVITHHEEPTSTQLIFIAENEKDKIAMLASDLLYIESSDNYSTICFLKDNKVQRELLRSSLSRLETQINVDFVVRCHRSYIVNLERVTKVSGNAQGYKLHLNIEDITISVARKYSSIVEKLK